MRSATPSTGRSRASTPASCSTRSTTCWASCTPCGCATSPGSATPTCCSRAWTPPTTTEGCPGRRSGGQGLQQFGLDLDLLAVLLQLGAIDKERVLDPLAQGRDL